ncbi:MAG: hypothetical protein ACRCUT_11625 [Spirochaetota bacterium]
MIAVLTLILLICPAPLYAGLIISEIASSASGGDWAEIRFVSQDRGSVCISSLYLTMYYGTNEPLSSDPVTLYSWDRPETPYDDRFAVIHLTDPVTPDETDFTGDANRNGRLDLYCNNYSGSLWNAECILALDANDDPSDGMIDCAVWSDNDGDPSAVIGGYAEAAVKTGCWKGPESFDQASCIPVPSGGMKPSQSLIRAGTVDTDCEADFSLTELQTPGRENRQSAGSGSSDLFSLKKKKIFASPGSSRHRAVCSVTVLRKCDLRLRVFTDTGRMVYESDAMEDIPPGECDIEWPADRACTGLYIAEAEGYSSCLRKTTRRRFFFIITRYK